MLIYTLKASDQTFTDLIAETRDEARTMLDRARRVAVQFNGLLITVEDTGWNRSLLLDSVFTRGGDGYVVAEPRTVEGRVTLSTVYVYPTKSARYHNGQKLLGFEWTDTGYVFDRILPDKTAA